MFMLRLHVIHQKLFKFKVLIAEMASKLVGIVGSKMSLQPFPGENLMAHWTAPIQLHSLFEMSVL